MAAGIPRRCFKGNRILIGTPQIGVPVFVVMSLRRAKIYDRQNNNTFGNLTKLILKVIRITRQ